MLREVISLRETKHACGTRFACMCPAAHPCTTGAAARAMSRAILGTMALELAWAQAGLTRHKRVATFSDLN